MNVLDKLAYKYYYNKDYDFVGENYHQLYPALHRYPATMIPQIGIKLLNDYNIPKNAKMLDPYCGSGSSFVAGLHYGLSDFIGYDLNPLAVMITKAKLTLIDKNQIIKITEKLISKLYINMDLYYNNKLYISNNILTNITNCNYWLSRKAQQELLIIDHTIKEVITDKNINNLILLAFSTTLREISYVRNNEFKLFRIKNIDDFTIDGISAFIKNINKIVSDYLNYYYEILDYNKPKYDIYNQVADRKYAGYDIILTSPPYGDSRTTVAYGQFSAFINEWLGCKEARKLDKYLLGGKTDRKRILYNKGIVSDYINDISKKDIKRACEVSAFYYDLSSDIEKFSSLINNKGLVFFIVSNRTVKEIELPTDQFIAEMFEYNGLKHIETIKRKISNKTMPLRNSPTNKAGKTASTMKYEYIVICSKNL